MPDVASAERVFDSSPERYDPEKYKSSLSPDPQYTQYRALPEKRMTWIRDSADGIFSWHSVDSAFIIRSVSNVYRDHRSLIWKNIQKEHESACRKILIGCGVVEISILGVAFAVSLVPTVALGASVLVTGLGVYYYSDKTSKARDAEKQAQLWSERSTFTLDFANRRKKAYDGGFPYVYSENLKSSGILHPLEIKGLYEEYFSSFCKKLASQGAYDTPGQLNWMGRFGSMNPLSSSLMKYGLGEIPDHLQAISQEFEQFNAWMLSINNSFEAKKRELNGSTSNQIQFYEAEKRKNLDLSLSHLQREVANAQAKRDEAVNLHHPQPCFDCKTADQNYQDAKKHHEDDYSVRMASLNTFLDNQIKKNREMEKSQLKGLSDEEIQQAETKANTLIQWREEEKAKKLKEIYPALVHAANTEFNTKIQAVRTAEKESLKGFCYEALLEIEKETDALIQSYEQEKAKILNQLRESVQVALANAEILRDEIFTNYPEETDPLHKKGEQNYQREKKYREENYSIKVASLNAEFESKIQAAHDAEKESLKGLSRQDILQIEQNATGQIQGLEKEKAKILEERHQQSVASINTEFKNHIHKIRELEKKSLKGLTKADILQIKQNTLVQIQALEEERAKTLKPYLNKVEEEIAHAKAHRDAIFKMHPHQNHCPDCQKVEQTYQHEKKHHEEIHSKNVDAINRQFNAQIQEAHTASETSLKRLSNEQMHEVVKYFNVARDILSRAERVIPFVK